MELYTKISKIIKALSSPVKLRILNFLCKGNESLNEIHNVIHKEFSIKYPQTTYNYLENLVENKFLTKSYDQKEKLIKYSVNGKNFHFDFENLVYKLE